MTVYLNFIPLTVRLNFYIYMNIFSNLNFFLNTRILLQILNLVVTNSGTTLYSFRVVVPGLDNLSLIDGVAEMSCG